MVSTRSGTGNSKPRVHLSVSTAPERQRKTTTKTTTPKTTTKKGTGAGVKKSTAKPKAKTPAHHHRKPHLSDKVEGAAEKVVGALEGKPGKKAAGTRQMKGTDGKGGRARRG